MTGLDYLGPHGGELALAFAAGCVATWVFMKVIYDQRITELKAAMSIQQARIQHLETVLMMTGSPRMQAEMSRDPPRA